MNVFLQGLDIFLKQIDLLQIVLLVIDTAIQFILQITICILLWTQFLLTRWEEEEQIYV